MMHADDDDDGDDDLSHACVGSCQAVFATFIAGQSGGKEGLEELQTRLRRISAFGVFTATYVECLRQCALFASVWNISVSACAEACAVCARARVGGVFCAVCVAPDFVATVFFSF